MNKVLSIILALSLLGFTTIGCLIGADVIKLGSLEEKTPVEETIDVTETAEYKALEASKNEVVAEKEALMTQLESKDIKISELQDKISANNETIAQLHASADADATKISELEAENTQFETQISELEAEKTETQTIINALNNQIISLHAQLEQIEYSNRIINDIVITHNFTAYNLSFYDNVEKVSISCNIETNKTVSANEFFEKINCENCYLSSFNIMDSYNCKYPNNNTSAGFVLRKTDYPLYGRDGYTTFSIKCVDFEGNDLIYSEEENITFLAVDCEYVLYSSEELIELNLPQNFTLKTLNLVVVAELG